MLSATTQELVGVQGAGYRVRDLGWHRLKDISEPEHLFEVEARGLEAEHPPLRSLGTEASLPTYATELIGRSREVAEICDLFDRDGGRLVTLTGTGGSGKTRLAVAVAGELHHRVARDTYFVGLPAYDRATLMWSAIADAVSAPADAALAPDDRALQFLADRSAFLVLDNLEQIPDAGRRRPPVAGRGAGAADPGHLASATAPRGRAAVPPRAARSPRARSRRRSRRGTGRGGRPLRPAREDGQTDLRPDPGQRRRRRRPLPATRRPAPGDRAGGCPLAAAQPESPLAPHRRPADAHRGDG